MNKRPVVDGYFFVLLICLLSSLFLLYGKSRDVEKLTSALNNQSSLYADYDLRIGDWVPSVNLTNLAGSETRLLRPDAYRLAVFVSTECKACAFQTNDWWPQIASDPEFKGLNPLLVFTDRQAPDPGFLDEALFTEHVGFSSHQDLQRSYRLFTVPVTVIMSPTGEVVYLHQGVFDTTAYQMLKEAASSL